MIAWTLLLISIPTLVTIIVFQQLQARRVLERLSAALDAALHGESIPETFDEALPSSIETQLKNLLAASTLTQAKLAEEKAQIESLVSDVAHQTRTPVSNLLIYAQLMRDRTSDPEAAACAAEIESQACKLQNLVETLVKSSRLEAGLMQFHPQQNSVAALMKAAVALYRPAAEAKAVILSYQQTEVCAVFDPKWTLEALGNLVDNAVKYVPSGGHVHLCAEALEFYCRVDVVDDGPGVPESERAAIFSRFRRGVAHAQEAGVGLGLYLCRQIAACQGGYVKLSCPPGGGSVFSLYLPNLSTPQDS